MARGTGPGLDAMRWSVDEQAEIRRDIFRWLQGQEIANGGYEFRREFLRSAYSYRGHQIALMDPQTGIWNPRGFDTTLSITNTLKGPYDDEANAEYLRYSYERRSGQPLLSGRNLKLRAAAERQDPVILFQEVLPALYVPRYPVFLERDDPVEGYVDVFLDRALSDPEDPLYDSGTPKAYAERVRKVRLHQQDFRRRVVYAYEYHCAICELDIPALIDAAHITPDAHVSSSTEVSNGLALCKLHHAAFDGNLLGIDRHYRVSVRPDVLALPGTSLVKYGMQDMNGRLLYVPSAMSLRPDPASLDRRFQEYLKVADRERTRGAPKATS
ncbi:HNH endonuclease [Arthrobacter sp. RCC_34]|uniref:HNH endonuclease n=1 Tax=Arthrobacter sp. RCC_34 TaxID=3239230 RepID=UPI0035260A8B